MNERDVGNCGRGLIGNERPLNELGFDHCEQAVLFIARYYFQSFAIPESQAWISALSEADRQFGTDDGARIATLILGYVQSVRVSRRSTFLFSTPECSGCSAIVTEHERRLISALGALRQLQPGRARMELLMLCEGNDIEKALQSGQRLERSLAKLPGQFSKQLNWMGARR